MNFLFLILSFLNPSIKLESGKTIKLDGKGPPLLFSSGLFGTMPDFLYSRLLKKIKRDFTVITIDGFNPIVKTDIQDIVNTIAVENIAYLSHSSFNYDVLENENINNAILIDPITLPKINMNGVSRQYINVNFPTTIIKASKLYNTDFSLPEWQDPKINGNITTFIYENVGHPDLLDNFWANLAKTYGFWDSTNGKIVSFKNWTYKNNNINKIREKYRIFISNQTKNLILN